MSCNPFHNRVKTIRTNGIVHRNLNKVQSDYQHQLTPVEKAILDAKNTCAVESSEDCVVAWDIVEELSRTAADKKQKEPIKLNNLEGEDYADIEPSFEDSVIFDL
jgi:hypothetical protein